MGAAIVAPIQRQKIPPLKWLAANKTTFPDPSDDTEIAVTLRERSMQEDFVEDERQPVEQRCDTELTLSPTLLLCLFFGLLLLCGLCFGLGYSMGSRSTQEASLAGQQQGTGSSPAAGSPGKPSPAAQNIPQPPQPATTDLLSAGTTGASSDADSQVSGAATAAGARASQPTVKPALPAAATTPASQPAPPALPASRGKAASAPVGALMVQIATVSHQEDADVLVGALRKRGYTVTVHRDPVDNQLHVQIGPFTNRNDANATRKKLLNDGYNAIVQP
jgi:cell division septation protein DedD